MPRDDDSELRRLHPKLRTLLNCDSGVLARRAETTGYLTISAKVAKASAPLAQAMPASLASRSETRIRDLPAGAAAGASVGVFVQRIGAAEVPGITRWHGEIGLARLPLEDALALASNPNVAFVEDSRTLKRPQALKLSMSAVAPTSRSRRTGRRANRPDGAGALIGIIDVQGFDWAHPDFQAADGVTRFERIWDQGGSGREPQPYGYGNEILRDHMEQARKDAKTVRVSPHDLEQQSEMAEGSHGTHVASIAAGNSGVAPKARLAAVLVSIPPGGKEARRLSFYDSSRLVDAIDYLLAWANGDPISINISLGTNGHAHDGSSALDRWIDAWLVKPGRSICVAAGNAGQDRPETAGDLGFILGRIHASGEVAAKGLIRDLEWIVEGDGRVDISENELEIWYEAQDRLGISIKPPGGEWIGPIAPGEFIKNMQLTNERMLVSIFNELYHPANGQNYVAIYLTPFMGETATIGTPKGSWTVRLLGLDVRDGRFHAWIERDDPQDAGDGRYYWPSYFGPDSYVDASTVSSLACGSRVISVANLDEANSRINSTSSQGPTRDGRSKPDVAAPGTDILAANGFSLPEKPWVAMTGTSMASPYVAGVVALMLSANRNLTAAQIEGILKATARPLPGGDYRWANDRGFGIVDVDACIAEARLVDARSDVKRRFE